MARNRFHRNRRCGQVPVPSTPTVQARNLNLHHETARTPNVGQMDNTHASTPTSQSARNHRAAASVTPRPKATTPPATITLAIENSPFSLPHNPIEDFLATRAQRIASYRTVAAGTARLSDMNYIFGTVIAPGPIFSAPYFYAISLQPSVLEWAPTTAQFVPPRYSGPTRDIKIDGHTFPLPTDAVDAFLVTREATIAAFLGIPAGKTAGEWAGYMPFVLGTPTIPTPESTSVVGSESGPAP